LKRVKDTLYLLEWRGLTSEYALKKKEFQERKGIAPRNREERGGGHFVGGPHGRPWDEKVGNIQQTSLLD